MVQDVKCHLTGPAIIWVQILFVRVQHFQEPFRLLPIIFLRLANVIVLQQCLVDSRMLVARATSIGRVIVQYSGSDA